MDSVSNIPLLDEDDSLLFDDSAPATADVFSCSPLIPIRSIPLQTENGVADSENRNSSVSDSANKENADWNKLQKLSLEPHQMKKKKKGGGYNLRKSLAWNRAFFTEEGVLNSEELSMISGTASSKSGLDLEVIHEEEYVGTSLNLQEIEENLFMHSSDALPFEDRKIGARFSPKPAALAKASTAPVSSAKRKIITVNDSVGNRPKRNACPPRLPVASSSLKRPSTVKAPSKEVKVARTPGPKLDVSASTTTARSRILTSGFSKRNQNAPPATNPLKHAGVKALSKNPKTIPSNPKVVHADKGSVTRTLATPVGKHLNNSVETHPPARKIQSGTEANKVSETSLSRGPSDVSEKKQETQLQTTKLSGLRMPSPSLGFFSIAKAPSSHSQLQKTSKPCKPAKSNILKLQNLETNSVNEARLKHAPAMRSEIVKGKNCTEELSLLDEKSELSMQVDDKQMTCVEAKDNSVGSEKISKQENVENILGNVNVTYEEHGELCSSNNASSVEDAVFPRHEKKLLSESHAQVQLEKETGQPDVSLKGYQSVLQQRLSMHHHGGAADLVKSGGDAQKHLLKWNLSVNCSETTESNLEAVNQQFQGEQLKTTSAVRVGEIMSTRESESHVNSCQKSAPEIKCAAASEPKIERTILFEGALCDMYTSENSASNNHSQAMPENKDGNICMDDLPIDDAKEGYSNMLPLDEFQLNGNIQKMSENKDGDLDMDDVKDGSSDILPLVEVQLDDNIQAITENNGRNLDMDDLQTDNAKEGSSDMFLSVEVQVNDNIHDMSENSDGNIDMDDSKECSSVILPLVEVQLSDNIQKMSENKDGNLDMDDVKDGSSDILPLVEVQLDDNIQAMTENNGRNLDMDDLQTENAKEGSSDMFLSVKVKVNDNIQDMSENSDGNVDMDDSKECSSVILPLVEVQLSDNIQAISENNDEILDMDNAKEGSSDILPLVEVQLDDNIQAMSENNERNLFMNDAKKDSSDMLPLVEVRVNDNIVDVSENSDGNHDMDDSEECSSDILPLVEVQLIDNIQAISGNNDEKLDMDDAKEGSSETLPRVEVQHDENIQAMYENSERNLYMDDLQVEYAKGSSDTLPLVEVQVSDNMQHVSENNEGNLDMDDSKECSSDILPLVEVQVNDNIISSERISSSAVNKDSFADVVAWKPEERCSLSESSNLPASDHLTFNLDEFSDTDMLYQSKGGIYFAEDNRKIIHLHESAAKSKQEVLTGNLPTNAAPFSDEWFTAIDSAEQKLNQNPPRGDRRETVACDTELRDDGSSRDASIQHHVHGDVTGNIDQQTSTSTYSKAEEMLCEYKSLEANHDDVVDHNQFSEVCEDFISNTKDSMGSGAEKPSDHIQHSLLGQFVDEFNQTNREIEESHLTTQVQSLTENPVLYNCNSKQCLAVSYDFQNVDDIQLPLDGNWLSTNTASSEETKKTNLSENALKGCDVRTGEYKASNDHIQAMPENEDRYLYADERREHLQTNGAKKGSSDILPAVEVQLKDNVVSSECNSFIEESKDSFTDEVAWKPEEHRSSESSSLPASDNLASNKRVQQVCEISLLNSTTFSEEAGTNIFEKDESPNTDMEHQSKGDINYAEDSNKIIHLQESATQSKREVPTLKPPPNAAPFSEEWLAAIEAAGEEILTMKGGAVQNSPTEKPQHEPGPWSPVRRKNQSIGPFDCTKHNIQPSSS
ncbi:uncharacterized protein LOC124838304 isoform X2 [Vigna umbellata]|uniref:uncharacterized protein LOC124838304 isoform X2 n=1 Tax=Vigna umbellata TaxID=87088 RepID=UPI001F5F546C|nr:uncharacterized protein LOC124838304 isoform X2 [Vigna umbellata]